MDGKADGGKTVLYRVGAILRGGFALTVSEDGSGNGFRDAFFGL